jgi:hypothetical protein
MIVNSQLEGSLHTVIGMVHGRLVEVVQNNVVNGIGQPGLIVAPISAVMLIEQVASLFEAQ